MAAAQMQRTTKIAICPPEYFPPCIHKATVTLLFHEEEELLVSSK